MGLSIMLHGLFSLIYVQKDLTEFLENPKRDESKISIKFINPSSDIPKQIVQTQDSKRIKKNKTKFLSRKDNYFDRETKSENIGKFQEAGKGLREGVHLKNQQIVKKSRQKKLKKLKLSDFSVKVNDQVKVEKKQEKSLENLVKKGTRSGRLKNVGLGKTNDYLDDMPLGDFTRLNTQEYEFYGFYDRIRQRLEQFWGVNIQEKADKIYKKGRTLSGDSNLITGLRISLNQKGEIIDISVNSASGVKELDDAAIESFNQAGPFPNPPKGMIKGGRAIIEWGFVVNT